MILHEFLFHNSPKLVGSLGFNVPPTAKVIWRRDLGFIVPSDGLEKPGIERATPGLQGE